jgi:hypothetical protein
MSENKWKRPPAPPAPMFLGEKERDLVKQINDEVIERVVGQQVVYYPIDVENTNFHPIYGESTVKTFMSPVRVYAMVKWEGSETSYEDSIGVDTNYTIKVAFHKRRLTEDQDLFVRVGDFVLYGNVYYEIVKIGEPRELFGQQDHRFEIAASCIKAREGLFDGS